MTVRVTIQFAAVILMAALSGSAFAGDLEEGFAAHMQGDYATAISKFTAAAEDGNDGAYIFLGKMYYLGEGVPKDYKKAAYWYTKSAEQGLSGPQAYLGAMYLEGQGVPKDNVMAYMWWNLAAAQSQEAARINLGILEKEMTREQIAEAQRLAREWKPR